MSPQLPRGQRSPYDIATWLLTNQGSAWCNLGDWSTAQDFPGACQDLARRLGEVCELKAGDHVLDLAFGWGASLRFWLDEFQVDRVDGIELRPHCVQWARDQAPASGYGELIAADINEIFVGGKPWRQQEDALGANAFDAVICVDAAYHFKHLGETISACHYLLKDAGQLAFCTLVHVPGRSKKWWTAWLRPLLQLAHARPKAQLGVGQLGLFFESRGFHAPVVQWLDQPVMLGFADFVKKRRHELSWQQKLTWAWFKISATAWLCRLLVRSGEWRYAMIHARKKKTVK